MRGLIPMSQCTECQGRGYVQGIFHRLECVGCNAGGLVTMTGEALPYQALVEQLRLRLAAAEAVLAMRGPAKAERLHGPDGDYQGMQNRHRSGGGNWTGD